jgi:hypothetical protein
MTYKLQVQVQFPARSEKETTGMRPIGYLHGRLNVVYYCRICFLTVGNYLLTIKPLISLVPNKIQFSCKKLTNQISQISRLNWIILESAPSVIGNVHDTFSPRDFLHHTIIYCLQTHVSSYRVLRRFNFSQIAPPHPIQYERNVHDINHVFATRPFIYVLISVRSSSSSYPT